jgi:hypothetical protein
MIATWGTKGGPAAALAALGMVLAACSSGGSDEGVPPIGRYDALMSEGTAIADEIVTEYYSDPAALPTSGSAGFRGVVGLDTNGLVADGIADNYDLQGDLALSMDLGAAADPISGEATGFVSAANKEYAGRLVVADSTLSRDVDPLVEPPFSFVLDGTLTAPDGRDLGIALDAAGDFSGDDVDEFDHAFGTVVGAGCDVSGCTDVEGSFVTRRTD